MPLFREQSKPCRRRRFVFFITMTIRCPGVKRHNTMVRTMSPGRLAECPLSHLRYAAAQRITMARCQSQDVLKNDYLKYQTRTMRTAG